MSYLRSYHWWVTGALFTLALTLYITSFSVPGAAVAGLLGFIFEAIALISLAFNANEPSGK